MRHYVIAILALLLLAGATLAVAADDDSGGRPGWRGGPGMMWGGGPGWGGESGWGMGPGMMWGGPGWGDWDAYAKLPADKRAKLRDLAVETQRKMIGQMAGMHELMLTLRDAMNRFPVDKAAAGKAWEGMNALIKQMFEARLEAAAKAQDILGKDLWESLGSWGGGRGWGPPGR